jgi:hypothetical protein
MGRLLHTPRGVDSNADNNGCSDVQNAEMIGQAHRLGFAAGRYARSTAGRGR